MARPSLHEVAAMPFPASVDAMRTHYNPDWGKPTPEGGPQRYAVSIDYEYTIRETETVSVDAYSEEEAIDKAADKLADEQDGWGDFEVRKAVIVGEPQPAPEAGASTRDQPLFQGSGECRTSLPV